MRMNTIIEAALKSAKNQKTYNQVNEIDFPRGYSEPGYSGKPVMGNWNDTGDGVMARLASIFEKLGFTLEWSDEWAGCHSCGKAVRCQPDSYSWKSSAHIVNHELICHECIDPAEYLESIEGDAGQGNTLDIDPAEYGYVRQSEHESGWYGVNQDPKAIAKKLREKDVNRFLFHISRVEQFRVKFELYIHESEVVC